MLSEKIYQLALSEVPHIGYVHAKILCEKFGTAQSIFHASQSQLERVEGIGEVRARNLKSFRDFTKAQEEFQFITKFNIESFYLADDNYPKRLLNCYDPPTVLFYKGNVSLNHPRMVAIVGTRNNTEYGKSFTEKLVKKLAEHDCVVVSGLAFGIDAVAHKCSVRNNIPTIGVVGHGLDTIYPSEHTTLAKQLIKNGGLLSEFRSNTKPDKHHFPSRNRIVAGITDATIIVESGVKGGSLITAEIADSYHRDVFAVPGRSTDIKSGGCNDLIRKNRAILLSDPDQFIETMGWQDSAERVHTATQKKLFVDLSEDEKKVVELLSQKKTLGIDELNISLAISNSKLAASLLNLEMSGIIRSLPGRHYSLADA